jgi:hypothetical protein
MVEALVEASPMTLKPVYLVACVKTKATHPCPAKDLYRSPWFRKARRYVEATGAKWFILSAAHGLLDPDQVVAPYDATLSTANRATRLIWSQRVHNQLLAKRIMPGLVGPIVFLAGESYRAHLVDWITLQGRDPECVQVPLKGRGLGEQLAWLTANAPTGSEPDPEPPAAASGVINWAEVPEDRPAINDNNDEYIAYLRAQMPRRVRRRWGRDAGSDPALAGLDTPLFRPLQAG